MVFEAAEAGAPEISWKMSVGVVEVVGGDMKCKVVKDG